MARNKKSRGRDLKHTETQAGLQVSRHVEHERGRTNGRESIGAVSAASPKLRRKPASLHRSPSLTAQDIERLPANAALFAKSNGSVKIAVYVDPSRVKR